MTQQVQEIPSMGRAKRLYVTAPHRVVNQYDEPFEVPFGVGHVREVGAPETACGLPALNWPIFWALDLADVKSMCQQCKLTARREMLGR